ncbi:transposase domain-containing protein [Paenibacillus sp. 32352]
MHPFYYLTYLLEKLPQLPDPQDEMALDALLPWSPLASFNLPRVY